MIITFTPMRRTDRLELHRQADCLSVNGELFDFSALPEGATLPKSAVACPWLASDVERIDGRLHLSLILPHGPAAGVAARFPDRIELDGDGPVALPQGDETA